ncbi:hypothetical protein [Sporocytophaga myxococcoides]|uniref:hypothetical protein n=1 Tax=Sporocytophaga myxococcoides TaxID=153721 RepID=UPI00041D0328|nr:hypothetical protein [Sporocytophaga myxococcoides]
MYECNEYSHHYNNHEFCELIESISNYYKVASSIEDADPADAWKKLSGIQNNKVIPEDIDQMIKKAFVRQLKKYS